MLEPGTAVGESFVGVGEAFAPDLLEDGQEIGFGELAGRPLGDGREDGLLFGVVFVCGGALVQVAFGVGGADQLADGVEVGGGGHGAFVLMRVPVG